MEYLVRGYRKGGVTRQLSAFVRLRGEAVRFTSEWLAASQSAAVLGYPRQGFQGCQPRESVRVCGDNVTNRYSSEACACNGRGQGHGHAFTQSARAGAVATQAPPRTVCSPPPSRGWRLRRRRSVRFGVAPLESRISSEPRESEALSAIFQAAGNSAGNSGPLRHTSKHACASQGEAAAARMRCGAIVGASLAPEQR